MNMEQRFISQDCTTIKRMLPYNRQYVIVAIYEILDKNGAEYEKTNSSTVLTEMSVYGNLSRVSISVDQQISGTELSVTMVRPCERLSALGIQRAVTAVADNISQYLENELVINNSSVKKAN